MFAAFVGSAFAAAAAGTAVDKFAAVVPAFAVAAPVSHLDVVFALCFCEVEPRASAILIEPATVALFSVEVQVMGKSLKSWKCCCKAGRQAGRQAIRIFV